MQPAQLDVGTSILRGVTHNRRTDVSPYVNYTSIDPNLGVIRVDTAEGKPLAIIWNYGIVFRNLQLFNHSHSRNLL